MTISQRIDAPDRSILASAVSRAVSCRSAPTLQAPDANIGWDWDAGGPGRREDAAARGAVPRPGQSVPRAGGRVDTVRPGASDARGGGGRRRPGETVAGFGELWIDQQLSDAELAAAPWTANDPQRVVLNITTTADVDVMERTLREVWGGSLCVSRTVRADAELAPIQEALVGEPGLLSVGTEPRTGRVVVEVHRATEERQRELDALYGEGVVRLKGRLIPIDAM